MLVFDIFKNLFKKTKPQGCGQTEVKFENKVPVIDVSEPAERAKEELLSQCEKFLNYDEILQIDETDRKMLLKDIYENWNIAGIPKFFREKYSKYDKELIEFIYRKENGRCNIWIKLYHYENNNLNPNNWYRLFWTVDTPNDNTFNGAICQIRDILNFTNEFDYWQNGYYYFLNIRPALLYKDALIKLYHNNSLHLFNIKDFKKYRDEHNIDLYFPKEKLHNTLNKSKRI